MPGGWAWRVLGKALRVGARGGWRRSRRHTRYGHVRVREGPADVGPAGPSANYGSYVFIFLNILFIVQVDFLESFAGLLVREYS